jgi:hypothetical protein
VSAWPRLARHPAYDSHIRLILLRLLHVCPHTSIFLCCPHTSIFWCSRYRYVLILGIRPTIQRDCSDHYMSPHTTIYVSSYYYMCPHTTSCALILLYVSSYYYICVLVLGIQPTIQTYCSDHYMCPHTTIYVSSYYYICVLALGIQPTIQTYSAAISACEKGGQARPGPRFT